jgi:hypothetical protein
LYSRFFILLLKQLGLLVSALIISRFLSFRTPVYFLSAIAFAIRSPSIAALTIPPAYPAPSPQGYKFLI